MDKEMDPARLIDPIRTWFGIDAFIMDKVYTLKYYQQDLGLKCSVWKIFGFQYKFFLKNFGLIGL